MVSLPLIITLDAMKFPDLVHAAKPEPDTEIPQAQSAHNNFWDFVYLHSEATHSQLHHPIVNACFNLL